MSAYAPFAPYYDGLMRKAGYSQRADYLCSLLAHFEHAPGLTLDLACGTGSMTVELAKRGFDIYGTDADAAMLSEAMQKADEAGLSILFLCQKMQQLELYGTVDTVICTLDGLNHLSGERDLRKTFERVSLFLNPGGYFLFDMNTVYKHRTVLGNHTFVYDTEQVFCVWQNALDAETDRVSITLDFFEKESGTVYRRSSTHFYERAYSQEKLCALLEETGFQVRGVFADMTMLPPDPNCERLVVAAQKREA